MTAVVARVHVDPRLGMAGAKPRIIAAVSLVALGVTRFAGARRDRRRKASSNCLSALDSSPDIDAGPAGATRSGPAPAGAASGRSRHGCPTSAPRERRRVHVRPARVSAGNPAARPPRSCPGPPIRCRSARPPAAGRRHRPPRPRPVRRPTGRSRRSTVPRRLRRRPGARRCPRSGRTAGSGDPRAASSRTLPWVRRSPCGRQVDDFRRRRIGRARRGEASRSGSISITMPGPPPNGRSSTRR